MLHHVCSPLPKSSPGRRWLAATTLKKTGIYSITLPAASFIQPDSGRSVFCFGRFINLRQVFDNQIARRASKSKGPINKFNLQYHANRLEMFLQHIEIITKLSYYCTLIPTLYLSFQDKPILLTRL
jgi:hypothetical protein